MDGTTYVSFCGGVAWYWAYCSHSIGAASFSHIEFHFDGMAPAFWPASNFGVTVSSRVVSQFEIWLFPQARSDSQISTSPPTSRSVCAARCDQPPAISCQPFRCSTSSAMRAARPASSALARKRSTRQKSGLLSACIERARGLLPPLAFDIRRICDGPEVRARDFVRLLRNISCRIFPERVRATVAIYNPSNSAVER
jgi:hypothetical protein